VCDSSANNDNDGDNNNNNNNNDNNINNNNNSNIYIAKIQCVVPENIHTSSTEGIFS